MRQDDPFWEKAEEVRRPRGRRRPRRQPVPLAHILDAIARDESRERVTLLDIMRAMDGRAFGALLLIFALPNALPAIPGTSGILGLPLLFLSVQMMLGRPPWLPLFVSQRSIARVDLARLVDRVNPWLHWADKMTAPRLQALVQGRAERVVGAFVLLLAVVLVLPIPLGNMLPAFAICLIALGVLERDGLWVLGGFVTGVVSIIVASSVVAALVGGAWFLLAGRWG